MLTNLEGSLVSCRWVSRRCFFSVSSFVNSLVVFMVCLIGLDSDRISACLFFPSLHSMIIACSSDSIAFLLENFQLSICHINYHFAAPH